MFYSTKSATATTGRFVSTSSSPYRDSPNPSPNPSPSPSPSFSGRYESYVEAFRSDHRDEPEFLQALEELVNSLKAVFDEDERYFEAFKIMSEPERVIQFRVLWRDDSGSIRMNKGYRVQFNSALGPYKGGLRFHPGVNLSILKFLGLEQILKNSLTGFSIGGGKGGSDFDPKGKSDMEIRSFCQAFMTELAKYIGPETDIPAGDIGVGAREIGFMYGQYRKLQNCFHGSLTGKSIGLGGSEIRAEATGYGAVYFVETMYTTFFKRGLGGARCFVSGSGNAAQYTCQKLLQLGAQVLTCSDSQGTLFFPGGMTQDQLKIIMKAKNIDRIPLSKIDADELNRQSRPDGIAAVVYFDKQKPWFMDAVCDIAFPAATENEIDEDAMKALCRRREGKLCDHPLTVVEVANMPTTPAAVDLLEDYDGILCPGKAANAGGVAVSALEMAQNAAMVAWDNSEVDSKLENIMRTIFEKCSEYGAKYGRGHRDLITGANVCGFFRVADAMIEQGLF